MTAIIASAAALALAFLCGRWFEQRRNADTVRIRGEIHKLSDLVMNGPKRAR